MELQSPNLTSNNTQNPKNDLPKHVHLEKDKEQGQQPHHHFFEDIDSTCSTPYVSAPSSPGRGSGAVNGGFYYSAPASPMHFALTASYSYPVLSSPLPDDNGSSSSVAFGFEFRSGTGSTGFMSSADELFLNGKIRPMKLSIDLERPQVLAPLMDLDEEEECNTEVSNESNRGRDLRVVRDRSMRRRTRSLSPLRSTSYDDDDNVKQPKSGSCLDEDNHQKNDEKNEQSNSGLEATAASLSASSSRSSSVGRSSKRWVFLKDFLYRSKSEGRSTNKFWSTISFSPLLKEKKSSSSSTTATTTIFLQHSKDHQKEITNQALEHQNSSNKSKRNMKKPVNGIGKRRMPPSPHELHYTTNRAQAEVMRKKTFLPYRQGLLGCLGFSLKGYGAMNGIARALNPVSSR
ncbi:uncharacterized protein LOC123221862 [Mangifera indica]|uniref:uncharacterized protein LOC123221862 n=1 Tax=Mangifera indica TaxID=29780 RepID=UPI001CF94B72|nr:uncharacterized protein LOC123221862 [Mangifera indica]